MTTLPPRRETTAAARNGGAAALPAARRASAPASAGAGAVPKKAGARTALRTEAFIACIAAIATRGSAASSPHIVEHTQA